MNLIPKEILMSHLQRSEGAEEVSLPIDFFRDLLYQAMPRTWVGLTDEDIKPCWYEACQTDLELTSQLVVYFAKAIEAKLKEKNNG
jgi:hypothetical protein